MGAGAGAAAADAPGRIARPTTTREASARKLGASIIIAEGLL